MHRPKIQSLVRFRGTAAASINAAGNVDASQLRVLEEGSQGTPEIRLGSCKRYRLTCRRTQEDREPAESASSEEDAGKDTQAREPGTAAELLPRKRQGSRSNAAEGSASAPSTALALQEKGTPGNTISATPAGLPASWPPAGPVAVPPWQHPAAQAARAAPPHPTAGEPFKLCWQCGYRARINKHFWYIHRSEVYCLVCWGWLP